MCIRFIVLLYVSSDARKSDAKDLIILILANAMNRDHEANCVDVFIALEMHA